MSNLLVIYGASDDLLEFEGAIRDETYVNGPTEAKLVSPYGETLTVTAHFGPREWELGVKANSVEGYPAWPIRFGELPDCEGDPAIFIEVPEGTIVEFADAEED